MLRKLAARIKMIKKSYYRVMTDKCFDKALANRLSGDYVKTKYWTLRHFDYKAKYLKYLNY